MAYTVLCVSPLPPLAVRKREYWSDEGNAIVTARTGAVVDLASDGGSCGRIAASGRRRGILRWLAGWKCESCVKPPKEASISDWKS